MWPSTPTQPHTEDLPPKTRPRTWRAKFRDALRGLKLGIRGHSSFAVHFFFTALVVAAGVALGCEMVHWCLLGLCIGMVLTAELFNSAIETLFRGLDAEVRDRSWPALDIAAGAVLAASVAAALVGTGVFLHRLQQIWSTAG